MAAEIREFGVGTIERPSDVPDRDSLEELRDAAFDALGHVGVLVNSPGALARNSLADVTDEKWEGVFDVQLDGPVTAVQVSTERMESGSIVNITSLSVRTSIPNLAGYTTTKGVSRRSSASRPRKTVTTIPPASKSAPSSRPPTSRMHCGIMRTAR